jgi:RES domain-containing protein
MTPHPDFAKLRTSIEKLLPRAGPFRGTVYRSSEPGYANAGDLLTGAGSAVHGGRWNPPASFAAIYAACEVETAIAEAQAQTRYYGLDLADVWPRTLVAIDVEFQNLLDLTDGSVRQSLRVSEQRMTGDDWRKLNDDAGEESLTQAIGRAVFEAGFEGIVVRACDGGQNLVWFVKNLYPKSKIVIRNESKLR